MTDENKGIAYRTRRNGIEVAVDAEGDLIVETIGDSLSTTASFPLIKNMGFCWIPYNKESRVAMAKYFEEYIPEIMEHGFVNDTIALNKKGIGGRR